ncbi:MAG: hypothetical protein JSV38_15135 [Desulfobacterales bacterium]|nr:MAG: hypothetical protein JSV38_15135 [Desulfobacterales bacterium]
MKKLWILGVVFAWSMIFCPVASGAGSWMAGVKGWYASWDSAVLDWFEKDLAAGFRENGIDLQADSDPGDGYLIGPLVSYQTEGGKWSFSAALMGISDFSQDWDGSAPGMNVDASLDLERLDFDFAANYTLHKYVKVFVGFKYQKTEMDFTLRYDTLMTRRVFDYKLDADAYMPTAGVGLAYPIHEKFALGLQLGILYADIDLKITDEEGETFDIWPRSTFGFNGEVTINYQAMDNLIVQLGYRYQIWQLEARRPQTLEKIVSDDVTHGVTGLVVYLF